MFLMCPLYAVMKSVVYVNAGYQNFHSNYVKYYFKTVVIYKM